ncbi:MAG TPA: hypothetical protein VFV50_17705 [Bdellovibrionales bacterium]|nr:hypothetical protein [Bdellovibrionales bacterium]
MKKLFIFMLVALSPVLQSCAKTDYEFAKASPRLAGDPILAPIRELKDDICGGGRSRGKYFDVGGSNECTMPATNDATCDRWGCAVQVSPFGDLDCPAGTVKRITSTEPAEYFVCVKRIDSNLPAPELCGGARLPGKSQDDFSNESCTDPVTNDLACNRWGCAVMIDEHGTSGCPSGTQTARLSDNPTYFLCFR